MVFMVSEAPSEYRYYVLTEALTMYKLFSLLTGNINELIEFLDK